MFEGCVRAHWLVENSMVQLLTIVTALFMIMLDLVFNIVYFLLQVVVKETFHK